MRTNIQSFSFGEVFSMSIVKWNPFREMEAMHNEMNRLFSQVSGFGANGYGRFNTGQNSESHWILPVDVVETKDALKLKASLPGIEPQDVKVEVNDNVLTISGERRHEAQTEEGGYQWIEQQYGMFSRSVTLPRYSDAEKIEARYNHGVLELTVPKKEGAKPRRIELQTGGSEPKAIEAGETVEAAEASAS